MQAMALADRWGRPLDEVLNMTVDEFNHWLAYFEIRANGKK
jgi:hypothetical protein